MASNEAKRQEAYRDNERLRAAMPHRPVTQASQLWRMRDELAQKKGNCQTVYWVKPKPKEPMQITKPMKHDSERWMVSSSYKGGWLNNKHHGFGIKIWANGNKYEGEFANGMRHGRGTFWTRDTKIGKDENVFRTQARSIIEGSSTSGSTSSTLDDDKNLRRVYTGNWAYDEKDGLGTQFYPDGSRYEGEFKRGKRHGRGTLFNVNGTTYVGEWVDDVQCGFGTLTAENWVYEGQFHNGQREGQGIQYSIDKELVFDGEWVNDAPRCGVYLSAAEFFAESDAAADAHPDTDASGSTTQPNGDEVDSIIPATLTQSKAAIESKSLAAVKGTTALNLTTHSLTAAQRRKAFRLHFRPLPRLQLENPDEILLQEMALVKEERRAARTLPFLDLEKMFGEEGLDDLRRVFAEADADTAAGGSGGAGYVKPRQLLGMFHRLGFSLSLPDLAQLLVDVGKSGAATLVSGLGSDGSSSKKISQVSFIDFVKLAHLIDAKAALQARRQQQSQTQYNHPAGATLLGAEHVNADGEAAGSTDYKYVQYNDGLQLKLGPNSFLHGRQSTSSRSTRSSSIDEREGSEAELHEDAGESYYGEDYASYYQSAAVEDG